MHLIGLSLQKKLGVKWLADFRDPWTNIDFYNDLLLIGFADRCHKKLEKKVLRSADCVITVSPTMTEEFRTLGVKEVITITNGYDEEPKTSDESTEEKFSLLHLGSLPKSRNPENLWFVLSDLIKNNAKFASQLQIRLIGKVDLKVLDSIRHYGLQDYLLYESYVPHDQTLQILTEAGILLLCINNTPNSKGILTNKFFEYLSAHRPILALGPIDGDAAVILNETGAGKIFKFEDTTELKKHVLTLFDLYSQHNLHVESHNIDKFSRKNLTRELSELLNKLL
jgi:hypothetical protein